MNYWRMTFRIGGLKLDLWPECYDRGIAAIGEYNEYDDSIPDLRHMSEAEFGDLWNRGDFTSITARISFTNLRFRMTTGDVIYVKGQKEIVGCGVVTSEYDYDTNIMGGTADWEHFVRVKWDPDFKPIKALLGAERLTILHLRDARLDYLARLLRESGQMLKGSAPLQEIAAPDETESRLQNDSQHSSPRHPPQGVGYPAP